jgi:predicted transcriptional regulator
MKPIFAHRYIGLLMAKVEYRKAGVLNELDAVSFVLYLSENGEGFATDLRAVVANYDRVKRLAEMLKSDGLIAVDIESEPRVKIRYSLTTKGQRVADKLKEIDAIMAEKV